MWLFYLFGGNNMKKYEIVKEHKEFDDVIQNGRYSNGKYFVIYNKDGKKDFPRFGIAVGKKVGNAVTRNKFKRQVRMIIINNKNLFKNNKDYIIIVKRNALNLNYEQMEKEIIRLMENR